MLRVAKKLAILFALVLNGGAVALSVFDLDGAVMVSRFLPLFLPVVNLLAVLILWGERWRTVNALERQVQEISAEKHSYRLTIAELKGQLTG